ncbi:universal stress protein [Trujillonella endophytica]|uniref:Universal stress protein family protein n=1 Tax=Trujillonella endophytica TaxID=673521 RepID=A0A1H8VDJ9_9ACTN|nr:universal stress protein [Trujillella endophytica]SEP12938.1 Universal stress protein family protein [Trujillella endophytica]
MTVVVGYVPGPIGEAALQAALAEADRRREPLLVVNVGQPDAANDPRFLDEGERIRLADRLLFEGAAFEIEQLVRGREAAEELVAEAERVDASLIVVGLRRRSPTGKLLFGSQAQRVLLDADRPVLAVKAPH